MQSEGERLLRALRQRVAKRVRNQPESVLAPRSEQGFTGRIQQAKARYAPQALAIHRQPVVLKKCSPSTILPMSLRQRPIQTGGFDDFSEPTRIVGIHTQHKRMAEKARAQRGALPLRGGPRVEGIRRRVIGS